MNTIDAKIRTDRRLSFAFWVVAAFILVITDFLLVAEMFDIWIGPVKMIITAHGPKAGILGGLSALFSGEIGYGVKLIFYGLMRGIPGKLNLVLFAVLVVLGILRWKYKERKSGPDQRQLMGSESVGQRQI